MTSIQFLDKNMAGTEIGVYTPTLPLMSHVVRYKLLRVLKMLVFASLIQKKKNGLNYLSLEIQHTKGVQDLSAEKGMKWIKEARKKSEGRPKWTDL